MTDNRWYERGELPPVGIECERIDHEGSVFIVSKHHFDDRIVIFSDRKTSGPLFYGYRSYFRPLKSDRDKAIQAALKVESEIDQLCCTYGKLYDAGLLKLPEQK